MEYKWESVGNQDYMVRKVCYLGPYLLEHVEREWVTFHNISGKQTVLMMDSYVYRWDDDSKCPERIHELPVVEYKSEESYKHLEDWYAMNVLVDELFTGDSNGSV